MQSAFARWRRVRTSRHLDVCRSIRQTGDVHQEADRIARLEVDAHCARSQARLEVAPHVLVAGIIVAGEIEGSGQPERKGPIAMAAAKGSADLFGLGIKNRAAVHRSNVRVNVNLPCARPRVDHAYAGSVGGAAGLVLPRRHHIGIETAHHQQSSIGGVQPPGGTRQPLRVLVGGQWFVDDDPDGHRVVAVQFEQQRLELFDERLVVRAPVCDDRVERVGGDHAQGSGVVADEYVSTHPHPSSGMSGRTARDWMERSCAGRASIARSGENVKATIGLHIAAASR